MRDELLPYYERELRYVRRLAAEFAERYPAVAGQLLIEPEKCEDPHVERLIEAFALLTARIRLKIDDDFPEAADAFLGIVFPHLIAPIPSLTIAQLALDPEWSKEGEGLKVERGTRLTARPVDGVRCAFRTSYGTTLWPVRVDSVEAVPLGEREVGCPPGVRGAVRIRLKTFGGRPFAKVGVDELRFFLDRDPVVVQRLYELFFREPRGLLLREPQPAPGVPAIAPVFLSSEHLVADGFETEEALLPHPPGSSHGHRLLLEYFAFPDKFHFALVRGLARAASRLSSDSLDVLVLLDEFPLDLQGKLGPDNVKLGCTPAVNLFEHGADPIRFDQREVEYRIVPDVHATNAFEVHAILTVDSLAPRSGQTRTFRPFYGLRHGDDDPEETAFWHMVRRPSGREGDLGTDVYVTLVDRKFRPRSGEAGEVLNVHLLCSNRDLPAQLPLGAEGDDFRVEGKPGIERVRCLRKPTRTVRPALGTEGRWRIVSHLSLNFLSLLDVSHGPPPDDLSGVSSGSPALDAFREILKLYDFTDSAVTRQRILGVTGVSARPVLRRITSRGETVHARGLEVRLKLDEDHFAGSGVFLFASVIERFLAHYTSINSFVQTVAEVRQREGVLKRWPPRSGARPLL
ncbi:MAG: type VI secretion system baseplate subunit TssF [bacterium]